MNRRKIPCFLSDPDFWSWGWGSFIIFCFLWAILCAMAFGQDHVLVPPITTWDKITASAAKAISAVTPDTGDFTDVAVTWTPQAQNAAGGASKMLALAQAAIDSANRSYANSGVRKRLRAVYYGLIAFNESGSGDADLYQAMIGGILGLHALRDQYGADCVSIIEYQIGNYCGTSYQMMANSPAYESSAYEVVALGCLSNYSLAHELGHSAGLQHDRDNASGISPALPYAYGGRTPDKVYRDTMSYSPGTRVELFGGIGVVSHSLPLGDALNDCARALDATSVTVANFRIHIAATPTPQPTITPTPTPQPGADFVSFPPVVKQSLTSQVTWQLTGPKQVQLFIQNAAGTKYQINPGAYVANTGSFQWAATQPVGTYTVEFCKGYDKMARVESAQKVVITQ